MILIAEVGLKRYFKCQDSIVFYFLSPQFQIFRRLGILCLNVVDTDHAFLVHFGGKSVVFNRAMDCVFEKHSLASIIMDSHLIIFQFCFYLGNLHIKLRSTDLPAWLCSSLIYLIDNK